MMFPFVTLEDQTEIVHSHLLDSGRIKVYVETPVENGFHSAELYIPEYQWKQVKGYGSDELAKFLQIVMAEKEKIIRCAEGTRDTYKDACKGGEMMDTATAQSPRNEVDKVSNKAAYVRLLSEKTLLAWIMKGCIDEFHGCDVIELAGKYIEGHPQMAEFHGGAGATIHVEGLKDTATVEGSIPFDIRFIATDPATGEHLYIIVNVEDQNDGCPEATLIKRTIYQCTQMISAQYGTEFTASHYEKVKKVYSVCICVNPPCELRNSIARYQFAEENLVGNVKEPVSNYDLITAVMIYLDKQVDNCENDVLNLLSVLFSSEISLAQKQHILEKDFSIRINDALRKDGEEVDLYRETVK